MFDIHTHILPAVDDGPRTLEEALQTVAALAQEGITDIVATPHFNDRYPHVSAAEVQERVTALQRVTRQAGIAARLWAGHEVHLDAGVEEALSKGIAATINDGPYVLLELPSSDFPVFLEGLIGRLRMKGFIPVIAHAERYRPTRRDPEVLAPLVEAGALLQVTASSLVGLFGAQVQQTAETLLRRNLAHVFASDVHAITDRPPHWASGLRRAEALIGRKRVWEMTVEVPEAIVRGAPVAVPPVLAPAATRTHGFRIWGRQIS
ncbi:MAG: tyrosine-protein phosphatase [Ktedonobacterales bacterium]